MTVTRLETGKPGAERAAEDARLRATVAAMLADIERRGDAAVREHSARLDRWEPARFRLWPAELEAAIARVGARAPPVAGGPHPAIVAAMHPGGAHEIYVPGGVQAIGAMALGTETLAPVDMIVGSGNAYVARPGGSSSAGSASIRWPGRPRPW